MGFEGLRRGLGVPASDTHLDVDGSDLVNASICALVLPSADLVVGLAGNELLAAFFGHVPRGEVELSIDGKRLESGVVHTQTLTH